MIRPHVQLESVQYERAKFDEMLKVSEAEEVILITDQLLESLSHPALNAETKDLIRTQITSLGDPEHRVREIVLCAGGSRQIPVGLSALAEELTATSGTLLRYVMHNKAVFTSHYMDIVEEELSRRTD
ncbi:T-complex protein 11-like protein 1 [Operophtera brumata]|uniref:T-complex protein 11-like protein 1 n=1 Tax=Operophtera brumata TaxID=104452 RepID=A0A0L7KMQ8_OPEBR|nr:T-complex protein 11-like protein 1 [Operophtera brumata]